jgi:hypothetical protein
MTQETYAKAHSLMEESRQLQAMKSDIWNGITDLFDKLREDYGLQPDRFEALTSNLRDATEACFNALLKEKAEQFKKI